MHHFAVNVPFGDDWSFINTLANALKGKLHISDLFAQHNEHRLLLMRVIFILNGLIKPISMVRLMYLEQFVILLSSLVFIRIAAKEGALNWFSATFAPAVLFCFVQYENLFWATGICNMLPVLFFFAAVYSTISIKDPYGRAGAAFGFSLLSMFSSAQGMFTFLSVTILLFVLRSRATVADRGREKNALALWLFFSASLLAAYFIGYRKPPQQPMPLLGLHDMPYNVIFFFSFLGNYWSPFLSRAQSAWVGLIILISFLFLFRKYFSGKPALLSIGTYGIFNALSGVLARAGFGIGQAFVSKYSTPSLLVLLSAGILGYVSVKNRFGRAAFVLLLVLVLILSSRAIDDSRDRHDSFIQCQASLKNFIEKKVFLPDSPEPNNQKALKRIIKSSLRKGVSFSSFTDAVGDYTPKLEFATQPIKADRRAPKITWKPFNHVEVHKTREGILFVSTGEDPYLYSQPLSMSSSRECVLLFEIGDVSKARPDFQIFWRTESDPEWSESKSIIIPAPDPDVLYRANLYAFDEWKGTILQLRIDPGDVLGDRVLLKRFELTGLK